MGRGQGLQFARVGFNDVVELGIKALGLGSTGQYHGWKTLRSLIYFKL